MVSKPLPAETSPLDPVAAAIATAPDDDRPVSDEEADALREARADSRPFVTGAEVTAVIAERTAREG